MKAHRILSILLALALTASLLCVPVLASGEPSGQPAGAATAAPVEENIADMQVSSYGALTVNTTRSAKDAGHLYVGYDIIDGQLNAAESNWSGPVDTIVLNNSVVGEGFTAVKADNSDVTITGTLKTSSGGAKGEIASDFTGTGIAILANAGSRVTVDNVDFESDGFVRGFAMVYGAAGETTVLSIENSHILARGDDPLRNCRDNYHNSADTTAMVSCPWVLGITGATRTVNVLGNHPTFIAKDSYIGSGGWACVSTDGCTAPILWILNSTLEVLPENDGGSRSGWDILGYDDIYGSGYGTFLIGSSEEHFYGVEYKGATYAAILNGGVATYEGLKAGQTYELTDAQTGAVVDTYTAKADVPTTINAVFGVTAQNGNSITFGEGVEADVEEAVFLYRSGATCDWTLDGAKVNASSGVILQMMDNDDPIVGGFNPFNTYFNEASGLTTAAYADSASYTFTTDSAVTPGKTYYMMDTDGNYNVVENPTDEGTVAYYEKSNGGSKVTLSLKNGAYEGDVFNGTGYFSQAPDALYVDIAGDASLQGDIALTATIHGISLEGRDIDQVIAAIDAQNASHADIKGYPEYWEGEALEDIGYEFMDENFRVCGKAKAKYIHFTQFCLAEAFLLGQTENCVFSNGISTIDVTVEGTWIVENESLVTYLKVAPGATVYGELTENADGTLTIRPSIQTIPAGEYGSEFIYVAASSASGEASGSGEAS